MKTNYFYIHSKLPNLNEFRAEIARSPYKGSKLKKEIENGIILDIVLAKQQGTLKPIERYPIQINCIWGLTNKRMDLDNRRSSIKFILDAMQKAEIIPNDSQKYICGLFDEFKQADKDYVKVEIIEPPLKIEMVLKGS